jgi:hypothetical protein
MGFFDKVDMARKLPKGVRLNNPGNIEITKDKWEGMSKKQKDKRFVTFDTPEHGIRAIGKILKSYSKTGRDTIEEIVTRWAPPVENDTEAYIRTVEQESGLNRKEVIDTPKELRGVIRGIIRQENGKQHIPDNSVIESGISLMR